MPGLFRIPPFRDSHIHFMLGGKPLSQREIPKVLEAYKRYGILTVHDMGHSTGIGAETKEDLLGISVRTAVYALSRKGSYGAFLGMAVSGVVEIQAAVEKIAASGADFIKVINAGVVSFSEDRTVTEGGFTLEELKVIREAAGEKGLGMVCHANGEEAMRNAIIAGASSVEHGFFVSKEILDIMAGTGTAWTPTAAALLSHGRSVSGDKRRRIEEVVDGHLASINYAASVGVRLRVGSDSGARGMEHGVSFFEELRLFQKAGLSLEQIVAAACTDGEEIGKGNFLLVKKDFVTSGRIESVRTAHSR